MKKGLLIVLSGPSGVGKGTIRKYLMNKYKDLNLVYSISMTTRSPRNNEVEGSDYFFVSPEEFQRNLNNNNFLEHATFVGNDYGTPKDYVLNLLNNGKNVLLEIEINGAKQVMQNMFGNDLLTIFLTIPNIDELEDRIRKRRTETEELINQRLSKARKELYLSYLYDYVVINDSIERSSDEIASIISHRIESRKEL